jgi:hypothetical protein
MKIQIIPIHNGNYQITENGFVKKNKKTGGNYFSNIDIKNILTDIQFENWLWKNTNIIDVNFNDEYFDKGVSDE